MQALQAAIFDLDGLLVDSEPIWHRAELAVFGSLGLPLTLDDVLSTKGRYVGEVVEHWYRRFPWSGPTIAEVVSAIVEAVEALLRTDAELKPGARQAVDFLRGEGLALAVASSSPQRLIEAALRRHHLRHAFAVVRSADAEAAGKPDPAVFLSTARLLGVDPRRCLVLEDSATGVAAALAAGMVCVAVPEQPPADLAGLGPVDAVLHSLHQVDRSLWDVLGRAPARLGASPVPATGQTLGGDVDGSAGAAARPGSSPAPPAGQ